MGYGVESFFHSVRRAGAMGHVPKHAGRAENLCGNPAATFVQGSLPPRRAERVKDIRIAPVRQSFFPSFTRFVRGRICTAAQFASAPGFFVELVQFILLVCRQVLLHLGDAARENAFDFRVVLRFESG